MPSAKRKAKVKKPTKLKTKPKKVIKKKPATKKVIKKKPATKKTKGPKYIQPEPARTTDVGSLTFRIGNPSSKSAKKDVPVPFPDSDKVPHYLLRNLVDIYYDFQNLRIRTQLKIGASERAHTLTEEQLSLYGITTIRDNAKNFEKDIEKLITKQILNHALYTQYLSKIRGIGVLISAGIIAYIDDIEKFKNVSSLWQYCGMGMNRFCPNCKKPTSIEVKYSTGKIAKKLHPFENCPVCNHETTPILQNKRSGYQSNWNDKLKVLAYTASTSFVKQSAAKSKYRKLYDQIKKAERRKHPKKKIIGGKIFFNDGHIHNRAMRKVSKIFLAHVWQTWRRQLKLEVTEPYVNQLLGHSTVEAFTDD